MKRLKTLHDVVAMLGGAAETGRWAGTNKSHVENWFKLNSIPPGLHLRLLIEAYRRGCWIDPRVFGFEGDNAIDLEAMRPGE